ncbi:MAG: metal-dependent transcriptional regulator [Candidatus Izemoplasmatales bacterium]|jgi:Mn-dependent DtxR family transcriptional regulator|nr:metal-dependent transcriptional regulator [Candidatus Izemoplasmatales bacterium]
MTQKNNTYSESLEDYLEAINMLGGSHVRSVDIANQLQISKASVNRAVNTLMDNGLVQKELYGDISLTKEGRENSERVLKKHLLIKKFLIEILGVEEKMANDEACGIEHNISEDTAEKLECLMENLINKKS